MVGFGRDKGVRWQAVLEWSEERGLELGRGERCMQTYASFELRRDHVAAAVSGLHAASATELDLSPSPPAALPLFQMPRALAWTLARRHVEEALRERASAALRRASGATQVRDIELEVSFRRVSAAPVRLPAYVLSYTHGTTLSDDQSKSIVPERCAVLLLESIRGL